MKTFTFRCTGKPIKTTDRPPCELSNVVLHSIDAAGKTAVVSEHHSKAMSNVFLKIKLTETG